jgi:predicted Zn-dependent protease
MQRHQWIPAAVLGLAGLTAGAAAPDLSPKIPPGYTPTLADDEKGMWMEMAEFESQLASSPLTLRDEALNEYVRGVVCQLAGPYCSDIRVYVVRNPGFNASMAANGMMQVWTGLLTRVTNEDELAVILGHEIGHYTQAHTMERFRRAKSRLTAGSLLTLGLGAVTGVYLPVGESLAIVSVMSYSRGQESDADLIGARLIAEAGYDPHAAYRVWDMLIEEEKRAESKGDEPSFIFRTHPESEARAGELRTRVLAEFGPERPVEPDPGYLAMLSGQYTMLMEDQVDTNRFGRTELLLERHAAMGIDPGLVEFFRGEMYRQRAADGDQALAKAAYLAAAAAPVPHPEASRNLGYIYVKENNLPAAREQFSNYLAGRPDADDRAMIEFYLTDE